MSESDDVIRGVPQALEARSLLAPGANLLAEVVRADLLPVETFKNLEEGQVVAIRKIDDTVAILRQSPDHHYEGTVYGGAVGAAKIKLDITSHDMAEWAIKNSNYRLPVDPSSGYSGTLNEFGTFLKMTKKIFEVFQREWWAEAKANSLPRDAGQNEVINHTLQTRPVFYIQTGRWGLEVKQTDTGEQVFDFGVGDWHITVPSKEPFIGKAIQANKLYKSDQDEQSVLARGYELREESTFFAIFTKDGKELARFSGTGPRVDPIDANSLYYIDQGKVYRLDTKGVAGRSTSPEVQTQFSINNPQELDFDPHGNFIIIRSGDKNLTILDKETGDVAKSFDGVKGPVLVDSKGDILFVDTTGGLRQIQTNFQAVPTGGVEGARRRREAELIQVKERFAKLELDKAGAARPGKVTEAEVEKTLRESIARQVGEKITGSTNPIELEDYLDRLTALKLDPAYQGYDKVIGEFIDKARGRLSGVKTAEFDAQLGAYQKALDEVKSVGDTLGLDEQFVKLIEMRQKIEVVDPTQRRKIDQRLRTISERKEALSTRYQKDLVDAARGALPQIEQQIRETGSQQELANFSATSQATEFELMLANVKDPLVRRELRDKFNALRAEQRTKFEDQSRKLEEQNRLRWAQVVQEARDDLEALKIQISEMPDAKDLDRFEKNVLVTSWRAKLYALPPEIRKLEEDRLEMVLGSRRKDLEHRKNLGAVGEAGELRFGSSAFPVYKEPPRIWQPEFIERKNAMFADLQFKDSQGRVYRPDGEHGVAVVADMNNERTRVAIERYQREAEEYFEGIKRRVPEFDERWRITGYHMERLAEITEALNLQLQNHAGILILQGEAGTGKNVLVDMLGNLSNREVVPVMCNENTTKEDLTYEFHYDPERGTYKLPSKLIEALQTPGVVVLFDEINALKPGIAKLMNSLFDYRRRIFITEGGKQKEIVVDPTVLFVGTMNPQNYSGVNRLSPEVKSRSRVVDVDYPPFEQKKGGRTVYRSDEAEMLAGYMDGLRQLKQEELKLCWDYVINKDTANGADRILQAEPAIERDVRRVYDVIRVANRLREMYQAYQMGDSNEPMDFPVSLREATDIVMEMNHRQGVKKIVRRVIVPKIDDRRQKKLVGDTIDAVLQGEESANEGK